MFDGIILCDVHAYLKVEKIIKTRAELRIYGGPIVMPGERDYFTLTNSRDGLIIFPDKELGRRRVDSVVFQCSADPVNVFKMPLPFVAPNHWRKRIRPAAPYPRLTDIRRDLIGVIVATVDSVYCSDEADAVFISMWDSKH